LSKEDQELNNQVALNAINKRMIANGRPEITMEEAM
jgi:hypothetical protein